MKAVILAAGTGRRLLPYTKNCPKSLVRIRSKPLIAYLLDNFSEMGFSEVVVVVGYRGTMFRKILGQKYNQCRLIYRLNKKYSSTDNLNSLFIARKDLDGEFILVNGDVLFNKKILTKLIKDPRQNVTVVDSSGVVETNSMNVRIKGHQVLEMGRGLKEKSKRVLGMYKFSKEGALKYFQIAEDVVKKARGEGVQIEEPIKEFLKTEHLFVLDIKGIPWQEIDDQNDLTIAENKLLKIIK